MIKSFSNELTRKIYTGETLTKKERKQIGSLKINKAQERLTILNDATENNLLTAPSLHYHSLHGTEKYSIDADSRNSPWRITFQWENEDMVNVECVRIEDTH